MSSLLGSNQQIRKGRANDNLSTEAIVAPPRQPGKVGEVMGIHHRWGGIYIRLVGIKNLSH